MDATVGLRKLAIDCVIGAHAHEREVSQRIYVDVGLDLDISAAAASDALSNAVDYTAVAALLTALARDARFELLERFAAVASERVLGAFPAVRAVDLEVHKPKAIEAADSAFVRLRRERDADG